MERKLISIIVPVYNVEKYLNRCIESLISQTYINLEIILVDDGSPDKCPQMCEEWSKKDARIKVVHKKNEGLGFARNTGLQYANGEYILFVDSDDYIDCNTVQDAYDNIIKFNSDIVMFGMNSVNDNEEVESSLIPHLERSVYENKDIVEYILPNMMSVDPKTGKHMGLNMSASGCMFSSELIKRASWKFVSERQFISEDFYSLLILYKDVKRISFINKAHYNYCYNGSSLTHSYSKNRFERICTCYESMKENAEKFYYPEQVFHAINSQYIGSVIATLKQIVKAEMPYKEKLKCIRDMCNNKFLKTVLKEMNIKNESFARKVLLKLFQCKFKRMIYLLTYMKG